ncbi:hypothetical protein LTR70_008046 [Exophiala xenobiotica]|nr:hypothetical protein LTR70_008046 [Exophiala xenobiotica]
MTAAAAHAEKMQQKSPIPSHPQSPNPQAKALAALMGVSENATSPAIDSPAQNAKTDPAATMSQGMSVVANNLQSLAERDPVSSESNAQTSPVTSVGTIGSALGPSGPATAIASPQPMDAAVRSGNDSVSPQDPTKAMSYPNPFLQPQNGQAARGMSLPGSSTRQDTRSPSSNKKHRCPYCSTEFTRHHNLKSHLLTHSQEKPYVCSTCNSRFRRLHDLKRHTKLHTGERPHVCPKCNRKFARGDALARHNKGPGGCAGRRASMGSFGGDDDGDDDETMQGVVYNEPETMDEDDGGMRQTPTITRHPPSGDDSMDNAAHYRMPSTYPPIQGRPPGSFPPPGFGSSNAQHASQPYSGGSGSSFRPGSQVFNQNPMTESPTPISPSQRQHTGTIDNVSRHRSPSIPQYAQPYPPRGASATGSLAVPPHGPQLPPPHGLNPPDPRFTLPSQVGPTHPPTQPSGPPTHMGSGPALSSHSNSSSHGFSAHGSGEGSKGPFPTNEERLWAVVRSMEQQMGIMRETIDSLRTELTNIKQVVEQQQHRT